MLAANLGTGPTHLVTKAGTGKSLVGFSGQKHHNVTAAGPGHAWPQP